MKQTLMALCLMVWCMSTSKANHEISDSLGHPTTLLVPLPESSLVGGFSLSSLFEEPENFTKNSWFLHLGSGFKSDVVADELGLKKVVPPAFFLLEKSIGRNVGIGLRGGFRSWKIPKLNYQYHYYLVSIRGSYHFNVHPKVDPYLGISGLGRMLHSTGDRPSETARDFDYSLIIGCRYYLKTRLGIFAEYGGDGLTHVHGGFVFKLR